jgi:hypothetical protein
VCVARRRTSANRRSSGQAGPWPGATRRPPAHAATSLLSLLPPPLPPAAAGVSLLCVRKTPLLRTTWSAAASERAQDCCARCRPRFSHFAHHLECRLLVVFRYSACARKLCSARHGAQQLPNALKTAALHVARTLCITEPAPKRARPSPAGAHLFARPPALVFRAPSPALPRRSSVLVLHAPARASPTPARACTPRPARSFFTRPHACSSFLAAGARNPYPCAYISHARAHSSSTRQCALFLHAPVRALPPRASARALSALFLLLPQLACSPQEHPDALVLYAPERALPPSAGSRSSSTRRRAIFLFTPARAFSFTARYSRRARAPARALSLHGGWRSLSTAHARFLHAPAHGISLRSCALTLHGYLRPSPTPARAHTRHPQPRLLVLHAPASAILHGCSRFSFVRLSSLWMAFEIMYH